MIFRVGIEKGEAMLNVFYFYKYSFILLANLPL